MRKKIIVCLMGITPLVGYADQISVSQAEEVARQFFRSDATATRSTGKQNVKFQLVWDGTAKATRAVGKEAPTFYVFNRGDHEGFIIISGDDAVRPVLAYAHQGTFGAEGMPDNLKEWMDHVDGEITTVRQRQQKATPEVKKAWERIVIGEAVVALNTPLWNQSKPYNTLCPTVEGWGDWHAYTGCTITAAAMIMGYYQWPDRGQGQLTGYTTRGLGVWVEGVNLDDHPYRWDKMPEINGNLLPYNEQSAEYKDQENAISTLMRDLGVMVRARYDYDGTSAPIYSVAFRMPRYMKYRENQFYVERRYFTNKEWHKLLIHELDHQRPVLYAGYNETGGHAFVLDGYDKLGLFSVNWGWGGVSNGYYDMDALDPYSQGAGGSSSGYTDNAEAVIRILPDRQSSPLEFFEYITFTETNYVRKGLRLFDPSQPVELGKPFEVSAGRYCNLGSDTYTGTFQLVVTDAAGHVKKVLYTTAERDLYPGDGTMPLYEEGDRVKVTLEDPVVAGDRIRLVYRSHDGTMKPVVSADPRVSWEIILKPGDALPAGTEVHTVAGANLENCAVATFSAEVPTRPSTSDVRAYYAEEKDGNTILLRRIDHGDGPLVVPAHTGVVLATSSPATFHMQPASQDGAHVPASNILRPTTGEGTTVDPSVNAYILASKNSDVHFHLLSSGDRQVAAHRAYLVMPPAMKAASIRMIFDDEATGIEQLPADEAATTVLYDLSGRKVSQVVKGGIYIRNGKKIIIR